MERKVFEPGDVIFREGDTSNEAYRILSGKVAIVIETERHRRVMAELEADDIFGEMAMVDDQPRSATAEALRRTEVEMLSPEDFNRIIEDEPKVLLPYLRCFFERLRATNDRLRQELRRQTGDAPKMPPLPSEHVSLVRDNRRAASPPAALTQSLARSAPEQPGTGLTLHTLSEEMTRSVGKEQWEVFRFPYRIGRRYLGPGSNVFGTNDLQLDDERPFNVSRNHCAIERGGDVYYVRDRGSTLGTVVNGERIGANGSALVVALKPGENTVILGRDDSAFQFTITV